MINLQQNPKTKNPMSINRRHTHLVFTWINPPPPPFSRPYFSERTWQDTWVFSLEGVWCVLPEVKRNRPSFAKTYWGIKGGGGVSLCNLHLMSVSPFDQSKRIEKFCYAFNLKDKCKVSPCSFAHICHVHVYRAQHPKYKCKLFFVLIFGTFLCVFVFY